MLTRPGRRCGYISKLFESFYQEGLHIVTKIRKNMKNSLMDLDDKLRLKKRALIESVNDILISVMDVDHSRHRQSIDCQHLPVSHEEFMRMSTFGSRRVRAAVMLRAR